MERKLDEYLAKTQAIQECGLGDSDRKELARTIEEGYLIEFLTGIIGEAEEIMAIDPRHDFRQILELAAEKIVANLHAEAASIRLFDPTSLKMQVFGGFGLLDYERLSAIPVQDSVAGRVVRENRSIAVPSILKDPLYKNKDIVTKKGFHSLLAVPLRIPSFVGRGEDTLGSLQIYYREDNRHFDALELIHAEMLARRVSHVLAKKKILDLYDLNERKEKIVDQIFVKLSNREGIKLKDLFILLIPELEQFMHVRSCSLFTVSPDGQYVHLDATYPLDVTYHETGHTFTVSRHPYFAAAILGGQHYGDQLDARIDPAYVLIKNPMRSDLTSPGLREFAERHQIHSILLVPLRVEANVRHLLAFYAREQKQFFSDEEIELLTFLGKEIMKALQLEFLADVLHDLKNPAIAIAGFANRARKLLDQGDMSAVREKLRSYVDIVAREASRLQDLAQAVTGEGREAAVDLGKTAMARFLINAEVVHESRRSYIEVLPPEIESNLMVFCPVYALERILDNLLSNATKAIPSTGGVLAMRCFREATLVCLSIRNTGEIPAEQLELVRKGEVKGRGLNIIARFVQSNHGRLEITFKDGCTVFTIKLPLLQAEDP